MYDCAICSDIDDMQACANEAGCALIESCGRYYYLDYQSVHACTYAAVQTSVNGVCLWYPGNTIAIHYCEPQ
jgi:hypothetical protein